jgi:hypothetical protein
LRVSVRAGKPEPIGLAGCGKNGLRADLPHYTHTSRRRHHGLYVAELGHDRRYAVAALIEDDENTHREIAQIGYCQWANSPWCIAARAAALAHAAWFGCRSSRDGLTT